MAEKLIVPARWIRAYFREKFLIQERSRSSFTESSLAETGLRAYKIFYDGLNVEFNELINQFAKRDWFDNNDFKQ